MLRQTVAGGIDRMGRVENPETPERAPDTNTILEISPMLLSYDQGSSQSLTTHCLVLNSLLRGGS